MKVKREMVTTREPAMVAIVLVVVIVTVIAIVIEIVRVVARKAVRVRVMMAVANHNKRRSINAQTRKTTGNARALSL